MTTKHEVFSARPARPSRRGFTLVELLLVMFILSVLVALVVGVSWYVIEQGRKQETISNQKRLMAAIDAFRKVTGHVPGAIASERCTYNPASAVEDNYLPSKLMGNLIGVLSSGNPSSTSGDNSSPIYRATRPFIGDTGASMTNDAWGNAMVYLMDGGVGGRPVIVSAGSDGKFGYGGFTDGKSYTPAQLAQFQKDNVRSDVN
jgi:prepilin-type N-terminal cleavage/methylation domain-containing protein